MKRHQYQEQPLKTKNEQNQVTACINLKSDVLSYVPIKLLNNQRKNASFDAGAGAKAVSEKNDENL